MYKRPESTLTHTSPSQHFKWHELRHKLCCRRNISSFAASLLWSGCNPWSNVGPVKAVGDGPQRVAPTGALVLSTGRLVGSDDRRKGLHTRSPDGATRLGRRSHRRLARARCSRAQQRLWWNSVTVEFRTKQSPSSRVRVAHFVWNRPSHGPSLIAIKHLVERYAQAGFIFTSTPRQS